MNLTNVTENINASSSNIIIGISIITTYTGPSPLKPYTLDKSLDDT